MLVLAEFSKVQRILAASGNTREYPKFLLFFATSLRSSCPKHVRVPIPLLLNLYNNIRVKKLFCILKNVEKIVSMI
jgi:hypothetical protein